ncbi:hypothetical protein PP298_07990 [Mycobacteroides abscessus]|uniref:hypothetical protein n=1 Tax=Mycobacteroides abscessus TaxID=36809 RepID=UPI00078C93A1|nr:hypothetical protein [Mycobacteroides abscessus]AMU71441.1 hypothetical protein A3O05_16375 [Mycobacteroides abscessus]MDM2015281.1 hypothetical protein [Mycobacteroides abscessus]MDM2019659.1 hypothetical protein [Mycobacteroides abscessus]MDM2025132.1 hypothetical protein [Mycobacteroides abscessus]MDM2027803.1 hypothetical protein [Mycobacteroides abscessus]
MALRAVGADETAPPKAKPKPKNVSEAAKGTQRDLLVAMRDRIAQAVSNPECPPRDLASLTKRLQDIAHDISAIDARGAGDGAVRIRELEAALRDADPENALLSDDDAVDDTFDATAL